MGAFDRTRSGVVSTTAVRKTIPVVTVEAVVAVEAVKTVEIVDTVETIERIERVKVRHWKRHWCTVTGIAQVSEAGLRRRWRRSPRTATADRSVWFAASLHGHRAAIRFGAGDVTLFIIAANHNSGWCRISNAKVVASAFARIASQS